MESCKNCLFYSKTVDELNGFYNDIENPNDHYCTMYSPIPEEVFKDEKDCPEFTPRIDTKGG